MRKKILSLTLALVLCLGLAIPALATEVTVTEVIPCKYGMADPFSEGLAAVRDENGKWGFIDKTGKEVVPCKYDQVDSDGFCEGLVWVELNGKFGFIDTTGKEVTPIQYDNVGNFAEGLAPVELNGKWSVIDKTGKEVISCKYSAVRHFSEGLAAVRDENDKWGFIDKTGKEVIPCKYNYSYSFSEGLAAMMGENYKYGYIDKTGKEVVPFKYNLPGDFSEGLAAVRDEDYNWGFIDKTGTEVVPCKYDQAGAFSEGLARVQKNWMIGYIDKTGKEVIPCALEYVEAGDFSEGLAWVWDENSGMVGYIDKTGEEVVPCKYTSAWFFSEGLAAVDVGDYETGKWGFISVSGSATPTTNTASPTNDKLTVDGGAAAPTAYKINGSNYFKLRDVAALLNGSAKQFDVGYDSATKSVTITTGKGYAAQANDLQPAPDGKKEATTSNNAVYIDGAQVELTVYKIDGNNYFMLRDLGQKLGFNVGWESGRGMFIETDKEYDPNN